MEHANRSSLARDTSASTNPSIRLRTDGGTYMSIGKLPGTPASLATRAKSCTTSTASRPTTGPRTCVLSPLRLTARTMVRRSRSVREPSTSNLSVSGIAPAGSGSFVPSAAVTSDGTAQSLGAVRIDAVQRCGDDKVGGRPTCGIARFAAASSDVARVTDERVLLHAALRSEKYGNDPCTIGMGG